MFKEHNRYSIKEIRQLGENSLHIHGVSKEDAAIIIDSMLEADINGVATHGIRMLPGYISRIDSGQFSLKTSEIVKQTPAFTMIDAKNSIGAISAYKAVNVAINGANQYGIHTVFEKNCNTYGAAFYYAELMAKKGIVGFTCCNSPAAMPAYNGLECMLGTNPFAFACPTKSNENIIIDMATSVVAKSRFETARLNGEQLQEGWALTKEGNPTLDPIEGIQGFVLPMAGFKGYGIALIIDLLSGLMSGSAYLNRVGKFYSKDNSGMNVGNMFIAIDPRIVCDGDFYNEADEFLRILRDSKSIPGKKIIIPGDDRKKFKDTSMKYGIELTNKTVESLELLFTVKLKKA
ncbi:MAG: Ldh family oxidoreductase [Oscillospiraceae bacterium]|nr:Ldh family oxidoreductase [Oscillospiraceae bacterium]